MSNPSRLIQTTLEGLDQDWRDWTRIDLLFVIFQTPFTALSFIIRFFLLALMLKSVPGPRSIVSPGKVYSICVLMSHALLRRGVGWRHIMQGTFIYRMYKGALQVDLPRTVVCARNKNGCEMHQNDYYLV